ncbi:MAG: hypothetical protein CL946_07545 [Ectothiorhodospiraceae bacterium]|nr:hypothetical protein [Ectothiorhodospiraceae bacterium]
MKDILPLLPLSEWEQTRNTLQSYAQVLGAIQLKYAAPQRHWAHAALRPTARGFATDLIQFDHSVFDIYIDCFTGELYLTANKGSRWTLPLRDATQLGLYKRLQSILSSIGVRLDVDESQFNNERPAGYDEEYLQMYLHAMTRIAATMRRFKGTLRERTSPVQLFPHHFDLAMLWFSGNTVPGTDPQDEDNADEQMNFGFSTGDGAIPEPYIYITAYPKPEGFDSISLPADAYLHTEGFTAAILPYQALASTDEPEDKLLDFFQTVQSAGKALMFK